MLSAGHDERDATAALTTRAPMWCEGVVLVATTVLVAVGVTGLGTAMVGWYRWWLAIPLGAAAAAALLVPVGRAARSARPPRAERPVQVAAGVAVVIAAGFSLAAGLSPSQHVLVNRDPGSYATTAHLLMDDGALRHDTGWPGDAPDALELDGMAVYQEPDGKLETQFNHFTAVVLAVAGDVGGPRLLHRMPALVAGLGLLAVYAVTVRATGRPFLALAAPLLLAASMPLLYVGRDTFSEPFLLAVLWATVLAGARLHDAPSRAGGVLTGVLAGALVTIRIDAYLYLIVGAVAACLSVCGAATLPLLRRRRRAWAAAGVATAAVAVVGLVDVVLFAGEYASRQDATFVPLLAATAITAVVAAVAIGAAPRLRGRLPAGRRGTVRDRVATGAAAALVVVVAVAWVVRPELQAVRRDRSSTFVQALQARQDLPRDPHRTYAELTMHWLAWYVGVVPLAVAWAGAALAVRRVLRGVGAPALVAVLGLVGAGCAYLWRPSIWPDQPWAVRRFVPAVLPALACLLVVALGVGADVLARWRPDLRVPRAVAGALVVVALAVPALATTWPVRHLGEQRGYLDVVDEVCDLAGDDAAVVVLGRYGPILPPALRGRCSVPVAAAEALDDTEVAALRTSVARGDRTLVLVADAAPGGGGRPTWPDASWPTTGIAVNDRIPHRRLVGAPNRYEDAAGFQLAVLRLPADAAPEDPGRGRARPA